MEVAQRIVLLARRANAGDSAALDELLEGLRPLIVQTARLTAGSGSWAADDAAQDALLEVSRDIGKLRDPAAVRKWALRIATRRAVKAARRERLLRLRSAPALDDLRAPAALPESDRAAALKHAFDRLPARLRATAVLRLQAGLSEEETAQVLGCSVGTVKSNLHDARKRLTRELTAAGHTPTVKEAP